MQYPRLTANIDYVRKYSTTTLIVAVVRNLESTELWDFSLKFCAYILC